MDRLVNTVRPYPWGSATALPALMGTTPDGSPQAELWMGAHPGAPSRVERDGRLRGLDQVIEENPRGELGDAVVRRFGPRLPFLVKLLAADAPLSLQVHPDPARAAAGHERENARGIPLDAPHRTYRDPQHKPEMIVALTPFEGLCGFRPPHESAELLDGLRLNWLAPYARTLRSAPEEAALREVFSAFLSLSPDRLAEVGGALASATRRPGPLREEFAVYDGLSRAHPGDPGVPAALLVRHVRLAPGEALFLGAGVPHAYLRGLGVEIMAASDNVLRCGLTDKHVDVPELLRVVRFTALPTPLVRPVREGDGEGNGEEVYPAPVDDFRLSRLVLRAGDGARALPGLRPQILVCTGGTVRVTGSGDELPLRAGGSAYVPAGEEVAVSGAGTVFRATTAVEERQLNRD
ncbi:mannose-6-phosphate isomerase, class I [Streptomyces sp. NPDC051315]|uniref:mannose-6-phosphate isomerase, class I n=1 Tax=Streptomyces sp. NPDC051315 TaxID=3365650 RepID=UPI0037966E40